VYAVEGVLSAGAHRFQARPDDRLVGTPEVDLESVVARKDEHVRSFAEHRRSTVHELAGREDVEFLHEAARFVDGRDAEGGETGDAECDAGRVLAVGGREIEADYVVIATGSTTNVPRIEGIDDVEYVTSADVLDATAVGGSGIVMGFGYVGLELVPYLAEAGGMELTVIEHDDRPLDEADPAYGDRVLDLYREEFGVEVLTNTDERSVEPADYGGVRMAVERDGGRETIEADQLFAFTGRRPNLDGLGLENTPLSPGEGWVEATMQARGDPRIFVVGDANGREPILHVAKEQGFQAAANLLAHSRGEPLEPYENVHHHVVFGGLGVYPYVRIGHAEWTAERDGLEYVSVTREAADDGVFETKDVPEGLATLVVDREDGTVLGYQGLHYHADTMAKTMQVVIELGLDVRDLPDRAYHPTTPELLDGLFREASARVEE
jgi:dihydrolipoamide dehydrogenase